MHLSVIVVTARMSRLHAFCPARHGTARSLAGHFTSFYQLDSIPDTFDTAIPVFARRPIFCMRVI
jgi:hypothetical protein